MKAVRASTDSGPVQEPAVLREPLRVMWLIKGLGAGGAERLLTLLAEERDREGFRYEVAYLLPSKDALVGDLRQLGVEVHCLRAGHDFDLRWALRLRRLLRERRVDILHAHSPYAAAIGRLAARSLPPSRRPRMMSTEHVPWWGYALATRVANAATFRMDDAHITVSRAVLDSIPRGLRRHTEVVVHGIALQRVRAYAKLREEARAELGVAPGETLIGTIANFRAQKGYPDLLDAARRVLRTGAPARFVAIGQGNAEAEIRGLLGRLDLGDRFRLLGYQEEALRLLAGFDVFVLSSLFEGLPLALMEALALGVPVVSTAVGGVPELVTDSVEGLLVPPGRPDLLAAALGAMIADPERRTAMGAAAALRSAEVDSARAARTIESLYRTVATRRGRQRRSR
jgi:glycosyltransferase involved in cell wall biosynthesis